MERKARGPDREISLNDRLKRASSIQPEQSKRNRVRRTQHPVRPLRKVEGLAYLPNVNIELSKDISSSELFVMLVEGVKNYKLADKRSKAERIMSNCLALARKLDDVLPGDDEGVRFFIKGLNFLEVANYELATDVSMIVSKVYDERRFR